HEKKKKNKVLREISQWILTLVAGVAVAMFLRSYAFAVTEVRQCSMQNTLFEGQRLIESKFAYDFSEPKRGDIVIFQLYGEKKNIFEKYMAEWGNLYTQLSGKQDQSYLIKRVIAVPGETIDIKEGKVYIDGKVLDEPYAKGITEAKTITMPYKVKPNSIFVMGDNRENSMDSRMFGAVNYSSIDGKAEVRLWPPSTIGSVNKK
ncbi:MAG TPA: signal peptidase I, partial [Clostridia bacterium]